MHSSRLGNIVIDCKTDDLAREAHFWSAALGFALPAQAAAHDKFIQLQPQGGEMQVILQSVSHAPRVHLDIETDSIEAEVLRLRALGAWVVSVQQEWVVMQAPSGHRFCVGKPYRAGFREHANRHGAPES